MMIAARYEIIEGSLASDGDYQLRINTDRWIPVDRPMLVAIRQAAGQLLGQRSGQQTIPGRYPTDTVRDG